MHSQVPEPGRRASSAATTLLLGEGYTQRSRARCWGHTQTGITLDLRSHLSPTMQTAAVVALDRLLGCQDTLPQHESAGQPS
jgi:hypothetical protein